MGKHRDFSEGATIVVAANDSLDKSGAKYICDGVDDQEEIQAAIDLVGGIGGKGIVSLLPGNYSISDTITTTGSIGLIGESPGVVVLTMVVGTNKTMLDVQGGMSRVRGLHLDGGNNNGANPLVTTKAADLVFEDVWIENSSDIGLKHTIGHNLNLVNCWMEGCTGYGISIIPASDINMLHHTIDRCYMGGNGGGLYVDFTNVTNAGYKYSLVIREPIFSNIGEHCIYLKDTIETFISLPDLRDFGATVNGSGLRIATSGAGNTTNTYVVGGRISSGQVNEQYGVEVDPGVRNTFLVADVNVSGDVSAVNNSTYIYGDWIDGNADIRRFKYFGLTKFTGDYKFAVDGIINHTDSYRNISNETTTYVHAAIAGTGAEQEIIAAITNPDVPRNVSITATNVTPPSGDVTIDGIDSKGNIISEDITINPGNTVYSNNAFSTVTKITIPATIIAADNIEVGIGSKLGLTNIIYTTGNVYKVRKNDVDWAAANWTVDATYHTVDVSTGGAINIGDDFEIYYRSNLNIIG